MYKYKKINISKDIIYTCKYIGQNCHTILDLFNIFPPSNWLAKWGYIEEAGRKAEICSQWLRGVYVDVHFVFSQFSFFLTQQAPWGFSGKTSMSVPDPD